MKMNVSMSMGFLKPVTNFFKKYTALLPSIVIMVVVVILFFVMVLVGGSVKEEIQTSIGMASTINSLSRNVPSRDLPIQVKRHMEALEKEANQIETLAAESSMRELISYDVFPPRGTSSQLYIAFGRKYRTAVEELVDSMHALDAPGDVEIRNQTGSAVQPARVRPGGFRQNAGDETVNPMVDALCLQRSQEISVYAHRSAFPWYDFWENYQFAGQDQALEDCWDSQVSFWICEDIVKTIEAMNSGSDKVSSSPVKRLMGISFSGPVVSESDRHGFSGNMNTGMREKPNYVSSADVTTGSGMFSLQSNFLGVSPTGRSGNEDVDVIHFAFSVLVDNRCVMAFMKELCSEKEHTYRAEFKENGQIKNAIHNQITILDTEISAVDKAAPAHEFYRYGNGAVMRLDLICEYQFYRRGYDTIKPEPVKRVLGQSEEAPGQTTSPVRGATPPRRRPMREL